MSFQQFKERLKEYFTFTQKERNGILMLLILMMFMQAAIIYTHYWKPATGDFQFQKFEKEILAFEKNLQDGDTTYNNQRVEGEKAESQEVKTNTAFFDFDPNKITEDQWKQLGLEGRTIHSIINYLKKGGHFRKKEDLKKIYTLKEEVFIKLEPFIVIDETEQGASEKNKGEFQKPEKKKPLLVVELNKATKEDLMLLPMIGEKRAEQIIRYRELLGGYVAKEQLKEVYSIPDSVYQAVIPEITVNEKLIRYININADSISSLKHFYIKKPIAKLIVNYRLQHGNYLSVEELRKLPLMSDSLFRKIEQYLVIE